MKVIYNHRNNTSNTHVVRLFVYNWKAINIGFAEYL